jgi:hypothetical protein
MHGHGFPQGVYRVLLLARWHVSSETKELIQMPVERKSTEDAKSTNQEYANQAYWMIDALA